jgi:hypothetical protein
MGHRWYTEDYPVKVLIEPQGVIVALVFKTHSHLLFVTRRFVGYRRIRTADRIVARAGYSAPGSLELIRRTYGPGGPAAS